MRQRPALLATACVCTFSATAVSAQDPYCLTYNAEDGSLIMRTSGPIINYVLESTNNQFLEDADFGASNHQRFLFGTGASTPGNLSESNPFAPAPAGTYNLGQVLPIGLTEAEWNSLFAFNPNSPKYVTGLGQPKTNFEISYFCIPEPSSLALLGFAGGLVTRRRA